jgi:NAD(P)H-nitrite reductase large subunit
MIKRWCEHKDIKVHTSTSVTGVEQAKQPSQSGLQKVMSALTGSKAQTPTHRFKVSLDNGQTVDADLVIAAAGVKPNTALLDGSGVEIDRGILINHFMQTNIPEIYAAGDVAQGRDFSTGEYEVHAIQPTAADHGRIAAQNMAGTETYFEGSFNMNVLDTVGLISVSFGLWMGAEGGDSCEAVDEDNFRYISLQFQDDVMVGATAIGLTQHVGVLRGLIQGKVALGEWKQKLLEDPNRIMEAYLAQNYTAQHAA